MTAPILAVALVLGGCNKDNNQTSTPFDGEYAGTVSVGVPSAGTSEVNYDITEKVSLSITDGTLSIKTFPIENMINVFVPDKAQAQTLIALLSSADLSYAAQIKNYSDNALSCSGDLVLNDFVATIGSLNVSVTIKMQSPSSITLVKEDRKLSFKIYVQSIVIPPATAKECPLVLDFSVYGNAAN